MISDNVHWSDTTKKEVANYFITFLDKTSGGSPKPAEGVHLEPFSSALQAAKITVIPVNVQHGAGAGGNGDESSSEKEEEEEENDGGDGGDGDVGGDGGNGQAGDDEVFLPNQQQAGDASMDTSNRD